MIRDVQAFKVGARVKATRGVFDGASGVVISNDEEGILIDFFPTRISAGHRGLRNQITTRTGHYYSPSGLILNEEYIVNKVLEKYSE